MRKNARSGAGSRFLMSLVLTVLLLALSRHLIVQLLPSLRPVVSTWPITTQGDVLLTGQARVLVAPADGQIERLAREGTRVARGTPIVRLTRDARADNWLQERQDAMAQYDRLKEETLAAAEQEVAKAAASYMSQLNRLRGQFANGLLPSEQSLARVGSAYAGWVAERSSAHENARQLTQLEARIEQLDALLRQSAPVLRAPVAGTVTYTIDGFEEIITPERFMEMSPATFSRWLDGVQEASGQDRAVTLSGRPVAVILDSWNGLVAVPAPPQAVSEGWIKVGSEPMWKLAGRSVQVQVLRIPSEPDYDPIVIAALTNDLPHFITRRTVPFEINWGQVTGHLLPVTAVQNFQQGHRVVLVDGGRTHWKPIEVIWEQDNKMLVAGLSGHETILRHAVMGSWIMWRPQQPAEEEGGSW